MLTLKEYFLISIETNLFFQRIIKEHLFFIETSLQPVESDLILEATNYKQNFEELLSKTVYYASGSISQSKKRTNEFVTPYTLKAEELSSKLTGAKIKTEITEYEYILFGVSDRIKTESVISVIDELNKNSLVLLEKVIKFKKRILNLNRECKIFITIYQDMLEHDIKEAEHYQEILKDLIERKNPFNTICNELNFWNYIMKEHAEFTDGLLDPNEKELKNTAKIIVSAFEKIEDKCNSIEENKFIESCYNYTRDIINFKCSNTDNILKCNIKSLIQPLLADHILREANHYYNLILMIKRIKDN